MTLLQNTEMDSVEYLVGHDLVQRWCGMEMKLSNKDIITIANTGLVNAGKSSLFNALLDEYEQERFKVGPVRTTTQGKRAHLNDWVDILDTPGIDVTEGDDEEAFRSLTESDLIIAVHNIKLGMLNRAEYEWLKALAGRMSKEEIERKIIFVCTWIDERERQDGYRSAVEETRRQAYESLGTNRIPFMEVSAKRYILGMKKNNPALLKASRLPEFKAFLLKRADEARAFIDAQRGHELMALCRETREKLAEQTRELQNIVREQEEVVQRRHQPALDNWKYTLENFAFSRDRVEDKLKALLWEGESSDDIQLFRSNLNRM